MLHPGIDRPEEGQSWLASTCSIDLLQPMAAFVPAIAAMANARAALTVQLRDSEAQSRDSNEAADLVNLYVSCQYAAGMKLVCGA